MLQQTGRCPAKRSFMDKSFIKKLPKVELHLHLEGSIPIKVLWELINKYGKQDEVENYKEFERKFIYKGFKEFLKTWIWMVQFINEYEDFTFITEGVLESLKSQHFQYAELFFAPARMLEKNLEPSGITEAVYKGVQKYKDEITCRLIPDISRDFGSKQALYILDSVAEVKDLGVTGIGMGGTETKMPASEYRKVFEKARKHGLMTTSHAGETTGPEGIWDVINELDPDRIGHGTSAWQDKKLMDHLVSGRPHIELCPMSNVKTGVIENLNKHPIQRYLVAGLNISVNTDDPTFFNYTLGDELIAVAEAFDLGPEEIYILQSNAIRSAFCDNETKSKLMSRLNQYLNSQQNG